MLEITCRGSFTYTDCGDNLTIPNGFVNFDGTATTYNEKVFVQCDEGYGLIGDAEITCLENGRWNVKGFCAVIGQYFKRIKKIKYNKHATHWYGICSQISYDMPHQNYTRQFKNSKSKIEQR